VSDNATVALSQCKIQLTRCQCGIQKIIKMACSNRGLAFIIGALLLVQSGAFHSPVPVFGVRSHQMSLAQAADAWTGNGSNGASSSSASGGGFGAVEQIEFKIYPDGRVEETVRGVKGGNCHKVTERINEELGEIIATRPTEEMYEQEVKVTQTLYDSGGSSGDWNSGSTW
jgi:Protein of unknown function (DUF2997)